MASLMEQLGSDLKDFFEGVACTNDYCERGVYTCEVDIQVRLCMFLISTGHYELVKPEYSLSYKIIHGELAKKGVSVPSDNYPWANKNNVKVDVVVKSKDKNEFALVELKYGTIELTENSLFGIPGITHRLLSNKGANDIIRYQYWKDVRRIEILTSLFSTIVGGYSVLVVNDKKYLNPPQNSVFYADFSTHAGRIIGNPQGNKLLDWHNVNGKIISPKTRKDYPKFIIDGMYTCKWASTCMGRGKVGNDHFDYLVTQIDRFKFNLTTVKTNVETH